MAMLSILQLILLVFLAGVAHALYGQRRFLRWPGRRLFRRLARHRTASCCITAALAALIAVGLTWRHYPIPGVLDEFAYLLAGDTYAHGRLANPAHPLWEHFESVHILVQPTYASKYPPGQGLFLALGQVATGHPIAGVIVSSVLAAAAACWMLQGWVSPRWALLGGLMVALNPGIQMNWSNSFWGGSVPMLGGCLLVGGLPRFVRTGHEGYAAVCSLGVALLAVSRPYEGVVIAGLAAAILLREAMRRKQSLSMLAWRGARSGLPILLATAGFLMTVNHAVTGDWFKSPYRLNLEQYSPDMPLFVWDSPQASSVTYRHAEMEKLYRNDIREVSEGSLWKRAVLNKTWRSRQIWFGFLGVALTIPLLAVLWSRPSPLFRDAIVAAGLFFVSVGCVSWLHAHYLAPGVGLLLVVGAYGGRVLRAGRAWNGRAVVTAVAALYVLNAVVMFAGYRPKPHHWQRVRLAVAGRLMQLPGNHLAIVRYAPNHESVEEWVYNSADIDGSKVVWAREMDAERNQRLLEYFSDRTAWLVVADTNHVQVRRYRRDRSPPPGTHGRSETSVSLSQHAGDSIEF